MKKLMKSTSTQALYWDDETNIVWGELTDDDHQLDDAVENISAQATLRDELDRKKTRVLVDIRGLK